MALNPSDVLTLVNLGVAGFFLVAFLTGQIVTRRSMQAALDYRDERYDDLARDRDEWKEIAMASTSAAEKSVSVGTSVVRVARAAQRQRRLRAGS